MGLSLTAWQLPLTGRLNLVPITTHMLRLPLCIVAVHACIEPLRLQP